MNHLYNQKENISSQPIPGLKEKARQEGLETVWERYKAQQPRCGFGSLGLSGRICVMEPCRLDHSGEEPKLGICGADADIMVARNLCRIVARAAFLICRHGEDQRRALGLDSRVVSKAT